jgi:hypothetical protein
MSEISILLNMRTCDNLSKIVLIVFKLIKCITTEGEKEVSKKIVQYVHTSSTSMKEKKNALNPFSSQNGFVSDLIVLLSNWCSFCCDFFSNRKAFKMVFPIRSPFLSFEQSDKATFGCVLFSSRKKSFAQSSTFIGYQKKQKKQIAENLSRTCSSVSNESVCFPAKLDSTRSLFTTGPPRSPDSLGLRHSIVTSFF